MQTKMREEFAKIFGEGREPEFYFAPGRVNLIGEHTDYNGGHVFPCALSIGTYALARKNNCGKMRFYSLNFTRFGMLAVEGPAQEFTNVLADNWCNYPKGVMWAYTQKGYTIDSGLDILYYGNIPNGSGLSSSASIEVATAVILNDQFGFDVDMVEVSKICQFSENKFNGVNCGIMDQFAIAMGKAGHAIFLDTADLSYTYAPLELTGAKIVIACSNKKRGLADSKYNERRSQCETALAQLQAVKPINSLGELTEEDNMKTGGFMFTILVTFLTVIADQITKYFVCINMDLGETIPVIKNVVHLTYIINPGAAFGLFPHQDVLFLGIVMILLLAFAWLRDHIPQKPVYFPLSIGLLLGGAVGNALDRCRIGGVVDFFDFRIWPIFNVADIAICIGVACIAFYFWRHD